MGFSKKRQRTYYGQVAASQLVDLPPVCSSRTECGNQLTLLMARVDNLISETCRSIHNAKQLICQMQLIST